MALAASAETAWWLRARFALDSRRPLGARAGRRGRDFRPLGTAVFALAAIAALVGAAEAVRLERLAALARAGVAVLASAHAALAGVVIVLAVWIAAAGEVGRRDELGFVYSSADRAFTLVTQLLAWVPLGALFVVLAVLAARDWPKRDLEEIEPVPDASVSEEMEELWREHLAHGANRERARSFCAGSTRSRMPGTQALPSSWRADALAVRTRFPGGCRRRGARSESKNGGASELTAACCGPRRPRRSSGPGGTRRSFETGSGETAFLAASACLALTASQSSMRSLGSSGMAPRLLAQAPAVAGACGVRERIRSVAPAAAGVEQRGQGVEEPFALGSRAEHAVDEGLEAASGRLSRSSSEPRSRYEATAPAATSSAARASSRLRPSACPAPAYRYRHAPPDRPRRSAPREPGSRPRLPLRRETPRDRAEPSR